MFVLHKNCLFWLGCCLPNPILLKHQDLLVQTKMIKFLWVESSIDERILNIMKMSKKKRSFSVFSRCSSHPAPPHPTIFQRIFQLLNQIMGCKILQRKEKLLTLVSFSCLMKASIRLKDHHLREILPLQSSSKTKSIMLFRYYKMSNVFGPMSILENLR